MAGAAHLLLVAGLMLVLGYPLIGLFGAVGLLVVGASAAALRVRFWSSWPAVLVLAAGLAAVVIELVTPDSTIAVLNGESVTTGVPVLGRYVAGSPLLLALVLLAALVESGPAWSRRLWGVVALAFAVSTTGLVVVAGWASASPPALAFGVPALFVLAFLVAALRLRAGLVSPAVLLALVLGVATVTSWVQPVGDPIAGLVSSTWSHLAFALLWGLVEFGVRGVARRLRRSAPALETSPRR